MKKSVLILFLIINQSLIIQNCFGQWSADLRLSNDTNFSMTSYNSRNIVTLDNMVHVVWYDGRNGWTEVYYKNSSDKGLTWNNDIRISNDPDASYTPTICASDNNVHLVWGDNRDGNTEIYYKHSTDKGISWGPEVRLTNNSAESYYASVASYGSYVHVVWYDNREGTNKIFYKRSTDGGATWSADKRLSDSASFNVDKPSIGISGTNIHVSWSDGRNSSTNVFYKRSINSGATWGEDTKLTTSNAALSTSLSVSGINVGIAWLDLRNGQDIYYKYSSNNGLNWSNEINVTKSNFSKEHPCIAVSSNNVHLVWDDFRTGFPNYEIYYKRSTDYGVTWEPDIRLTIDSAISEVPSIAVGDSVLHVVWSDYCSHRELIYYKRNPNGNPVHILLQSESIPSSFSLNQNYPNPFNPVTKIRFDVPMDSRIHGNDNVLLKVYDMLGREILTLVNESLKPGTYETTFDGSNLNSGVYFYRLNAGDYSNTKKMILIK